MSPSLTPTWFSLPSTLFKFGTVGMIFDEVDGLNFLPAYGAMRELFADPSLVSDEDYAEALHAYLCEDSILPLPLYRLAVAYPDTVDEVYQEVLQRPGFSWAEDGEALLREYKPGYYEREPRPGVTVIGGRLKELLGIREVTGHEARWAPDGSLVAPEMSGPVSDDGEDPLVAVDSGDGGQYPVGCLGDD